jgi:hypothetical protein
LAPRHIARESNRNSGAVLRARGRIVDLRSNSVVLIFHTLGMTRKTEYEYDVNLNLEVDVILKCMVPLYPQREGMPVAR